MIESVTLAALVGAACAATTTAVIALLSLRGRGGAEARTGGHEPLFLLRGDRAVDASALGDSILHRLDHPRGSDGVGAHWPDLAALLRTVFPDLPDIVPDPGARFGSANSGGLTLCADRAGRSLGLSVYQGRAAEAPALEYALARAELTALREALERAPLPIWRTDPDGAVTWANDRYCTLSARTGADPLFPAAPEPGAERQSMRIGLDPVPEGGPHWFELISQRAVEGWLHYATEIDAVVDAEAAQRNFVQTLSKTFSHLPTGLAIFDRSQALVLFNPALTDLTGLSPEQLAGRPDVMSFFDMLREAQVMPEPRDYATWRAEMAILLRVAQDEGYSDTWSLPSGLTYRFTGRPQPDGAVAFLIEDISDEVSLTRRFRHELELAQSVIDAFDDAIAVFTAGGILAFCNAGYRRLWNSDPDSDVSYTSVVEATRLWQGACQPSPIWGELRDFVGQFGDRAGWEAEVVRNDGARIACRVEPIHGGATLVRFVGDPMPETAPKTLLQTV
ncbi:PAS-domain containing protein [Roseivivax sediminis]|uniref:PAS domain-containing protein n=1 Tax=Roseivivax sediminis TaxID=936889 RepID=A0A1I1UBU6_9RHOB|nr:PAS domain-containing protein [Roseivivax sediminis]SFD68095.1 PAS domain-containing protein [Roseivivax sediminis]